MEVRIEREEWWEPRLYTLTDHAEKLAHHLVRGIRKQWEQYAKGEQN